MRSFSIRRRLSLVAIKIVAVLLDEPSGAVGLSYRRYIRTVLVSGVRRVAATLKAHGAIIEVSASRRPRPAFSPRLAALAEPLPRPPHRAVAIESLAGGKVPGRQLESLRGRYFRTQVVRLRKLLGDPAQCLG